MTGQLRETETRLPELKQDASAAERSFQRGELDAGAYSSLRLSFQTEQITAIRLRAELEKTEGALQLLLGLPLEPANP